MISLQMTELLTTRLYTECSGLTSFRMHHSASRKMPTASEIFNLQGPHKPLRY